jgi:multidrug efflux pump subunit AcrA (membrane-fusion protein)
VAKVGSLAASAELKQSDATPVQAPPTATALASTVDLYYEMKNPDALYRPGQRLGITLTLEGTDNQRGIQWSAVEFDNYQGAWVYEKTDENTFVRRRVQIRQPIDNWVTFDRGPAEGAKIVIEGVAELSGTEFGFGGK